MDKETIIRGCENWVNNHKDEDLLLAYSSVVELLTVLKEQEEEIENLKQVCQSMMEGTYLLKEQRTVVQCEDCEHAGAAYFTDEGEMLYDCSQTECCRRKAVK